MDSLIRNPKTSEVWLYACLIFGAVELFVLLVSCANNTIDTDEVFSLYLIRKPYWDVIKTTAADVHPPVYYIILKFFVDVSRLLKPDINVTFIGKLVSVIPYGLLCLESVTIVKSDFGKGMAGLTVLFVFGVPQMLETGTNIRMYSWAAFFVFSAYLACCRTIKNNFEIKSVSCLVLFSLLASYTHYFAAMMVGFLFFALLIFAIKSNKVKTWLILSGVTVIGYCPWLKIVLEQVSEVKQSYWIEPITPGVVIEGVEYLAGSYFMVCVCICVLLFYFMPNNSKRNRADTTASIIAINVVVNTLVLGLVLSILIRPIFFNRYLLPGVLCSWFGFGLCAFRCNIKRVGAFFVICVVATSIGRNEAFIKSTLLEKGVYTRSAAFFEEHQSDTFVTGSSELRDVLTTYSDNVCFIELADEYRANAIYLVYSDHEIKDTKPGQELEQLISNAEGDVYFVDFINRDRVADLGKNVTAEETDCYGLGTNATRFYQLSCSDSKQEQKENE